MIQRYLWGAESCRAAPQEKRREREERRHRACRVELHDVDDDITRVSSARAFPLPRARRNLSSVVGKTERRGSRDEDDLANDSTRATSRFLATGGNRKNSRRARVLLFSALPTRSLE